MSEQDYANMPPMPPLGMNAGGPLGYAGQNSDTIASMRWENDPLVNQLRQNLGGYVLTLTEDNHVIGKRGAGARPLINDMGLDRMIALVRGAVNPVTSLSNIDDDRADELTRQVLYNLVLDIAINQDRWQIHDGDKGTIMNIMKMIIFMQIQRAVGGHESTNFRTQTFEQNVQQNMNHSQPGGWSLWPTFGKKS